MTDLTAMPWSAGEDGGIWSGPSATGERIGMMDTPGLAEAACAAHNAELLRRKVLVLAEGRSA